MRGWLFYPLAQEAPGQLEGAAPLMREAMQVGGGACDSGGGGRRIGVQRR